MFTAENRRDLQDKGYTVVKGVLTEQEADDYRKQYEDWIRDNFHEGSFPDSWKSLVHRYKVGHLAPSWSARLKCKAAFAQLWGTDHLLTSVDAVAMGRPPEQGVEAFCSEDTRWLHIDQTPRRQGLHSYQGAVYLETADEDDWTLEVLEGSHKHFDNFWREHREEYEVSLRTADYLRLKPHHLQWMLARGCVSRRVAVPKGGLVLWDSRQVHANANPIKGRNKPDRWRWMVILCMGPANWASERDLDLKRQSYERMTLTHHWPSQGIRLFEETAPTVPAKRPLTELPEVARSLEARRLAGVDPYPKTLRKTCLSLCGTLTTPASDQTGRTRVRTTNIVFSMRKRDKQSLHLSVTKCNVLVIPQSFQKTTLDFKSTQTQWNGKPSIISLN